MTTQISDDTTGGVGHQVLVRPFWLSWFHTNELGGFDLLWPWWETACCHETGGRSITICAAVQADSEEAAKEVVLASFDVRPTHVQWRFCEPRPVNWEPFNDRFERDAWMSWPNPEVAP